MSVWLFPVIAGVVLFLKRERMPSWRGNFWALFQDIVKVLNFSVIRKITTSLMMSVYCILFFCMQLSAAGGKYLREAQGWRNSVGGTWAAPSTCRLRAPAPLGALEQSCPYVTADEIERDRLRLIPGVFTFESKQEKAPGSVKLDWRCWYSKHAWMSLSLRQTGWLWGLLSFGNLRGYSPNERSRFFRPVKSSVFVKYHYVLRSEEVFTREELKPNPLNVDISKPWKLCPHLSFAGYVCQ